MAGRKERNSQVVEEEQEEEKRGKTPLVTKIPQNSEAGMVEEMFGGSLRLLPGTDVVVLLLPASDSERERERELCSDAFSSNKLGPGGRGGEREGGRERLPTAPVCFILKKQPEVVLIINLPKTRTFK